MQLKSLILATFTLAAAEQWTIENFSRNCTDPNICTYYLTIDTGSATQTCTIADTYVPAGNHSWYNAPCQENSNYHLSWGWSYTQDFTVMTVVDEYRQLEAFFGYNCPNSVNPIAKYPDVGPNAVQGTGIAPSAKVKRAFVV